MSAPRFILTLEPSTEGRFRVRATGASGQVDADAPLPKLSDDVTTWDAARAVGQRLFEAAFPPDVDRLQEESRHIAGDARLSIAINTVDKNIAALPWELLFDPETERFLTLSNGTTFVRAEADVPDPATPEHNNLRVSVLTQAIDETSLAFAHAIAADERVNVSTRLIGSTSRRRPHVVVHLGSATPNDIPARTSLVVMHDGMSDAKNVLQRAQAALVFPPHANQSTVVQFLAALLPLLGRGESIEASTAGARRQIAAHPGSTPREWAGPILHSATTPGPIVEPQAISSILGRRVMEHTVSWVQDALSGVVTSVVLFIVGLVLFRLGFSSTSSFELDIFSPVSLYQSFSALTLELANYQQSFLLIASGFLGVATACVAALWWRNQEIDPEEAFGFAARFAGPLSRLRTLTFLAVATMTVLGSYGYQQYLWRVKLPIPDGTLGIAITRAASTSELGSRLYDSLTSDDTPVVIRQLPVEYGASDIDTVRRIGRQIGAFAVVINRVERGDDGDVQVAYLVFPDPNLGRTFLTRQATVLTGLEPVQPPVVTRLQESIAVPLIRTTNLTALVDAAAGVIDYQAGNIHQAIAKLERARASDDALRQNGSLSFVIGVSYLLDDNPVSGGQHLQSAIQTFESAAVVDGLGTQDELTLVTSYLALGTLSREAGDWETAIDWFQRGIAHRDELLARGSGLDRPRDVNDVYARIYNGLATVYRGQGDREEEIFWTNRTADATAELAERIPEDDRSGLVQLSATRLTTGDCVGAVEAVNRALTLAPADADALLTAAAIAFLQSDRARARSQLGAVASPNQLAVRAHDELGLLLALSAVSEMNGAIEPTLLAETRAFFAAVASPSSLGNQESAATDLWTGTALRYDLSTARAGDLLTTAKSTVEWSADPARRSAAISAYTDAINRLTVLSQLRPGDAALKSALTSAYTGRLIAHASSINDQPEIETVRFLDDVTQVLALTDQILEAENSTARRDRLAAWALSLEAMNEVLRLGLDDSTGSTLARLQASIELAQAEARTSSPVDTAESAAMRAIYDEIYRFATDIVSDPQIAADAASRRASVIDPGLSEQAVLRTVCREERETLAGQALLDVGDPAGAETRFASALTINPSYGPAAIGLTHARLQRGDYVNAIDAGTSATHIRPDNPNAWFGLALAHLGSGNIVERDQALATAFQLLEAQPSVTASANLRLLIADSQNLLTRQPTLAVALSEIVPTMQSALVAMPDDDGYQRSSRYAELGHLALFLGDLERADTLLAQAIDIDQHQPRALADRAIVETVRDGDPSTAIQTMVDEIDAVIWERAKVSRRDLIEVMQQQVNAYLRLAPAQASALDPVVTALVEADLDSRPNIATPDAIATPEAATPVASPVADGSYLGEQYGLALSPPIGWVITDRSSEEGLEGFWISNGISLILIIVIDAPGATLTACLQSLEQTLVNDSTISDLRPMTNSGGSAIRGNSGSRVYSAFRYNQTDDEIDDELVQYNSCQPFPRPDTLLMVQHSTFVESYAAQAIARETLLTALVLPQPE